MLEDLIQETSVDNSPGTISTIFLAEKADIESFPAMTSSPTTNAQKSTRSGSFTMKASKTFNKVEITAGTGELEIKVSGSARQLAPVSTLKLKRAGLSASAIGWIKQNKNKELVIVVQDRNGLQTILGDEQEGSFLTDATPKTGAKAGDERGVEFTFTYSGFEPTVWAGTPPLS